MKLIIVLSFLLFTSQSCDAQNSSEMSNEKNSFAIVKSEQEWQKQLSSEEYYILRQKGTERPYSGEYNMHFEEGVYKCRGCNTPLFKSDSKFDSHCGWPSFDSEIESGVIIKKLDKSHGMLRTEILCAKCGGHLGHVFNDGPTESGLRYCVNSLSISFDKEE